MKKELQPIQRFLREAHLLRPVEYARYLWSVLRYHKSNQVFLKAHPGFKVPPSYLAFDAYSAPDWDYYFHSGQQLAGELVEFLRKNDVPLDDVTVLEWGCGPGRIVRHLPGKLGQHAHVYGSDYNEKSIAWTQANIPDVKFCVNQLCPPLPFENQSLDFVYAFSVFTHLSEESCLQWAAEVKRVLKRKGLFFFTTHSDRLSEFLLPDELAQYEAEGFCMRGKVMEGKKMFTAFHSPEYVKTKLLAGFDVLEHSKPGTFKYIHAQDAWFARAGQIKP